jgi:hypothetical protein
MTIHISVLSFTFISPITKCDIDLSYGWSAAVCLQFPSSIIRVIRVLSISYSVAARNGNLLVNGESFMSQWYQCRAIAATCSCTAHLLDKLSQGGYGGFSWQALYCRRRHPDIFQSWNTESVNLEL